MTGVIAKRVCAEVEGDFVVFLIGMRINKPWKFWRWIPVATAMGRMLRELLRRRELGLLHARSHFGVPNILVVQYWQSFDALESYARNRDSAHLPAWQAFNKAIASNGDVGIWHETYLVSQGCYETFYNNMPPYGLGRAGKLIDAVGTKKGARGRLQSET